jgi:hypothetical protein
MRKIIVPMPSIAPGAITSMFGERFEFSAADLAASAAAYSPNKRVAKVQVGHGTDGEVMGNVERAEFKDGVLTLFSELSAAGFERYQAGLDDLSISFYRPNDAQNPVQGVWYPNHLGFVRRGAANNVPRNTELTAESPQFAEFECSSENCSCEVIQMADVGKKDDLTVAATVTDKVAEKPSAPMFSESDVQALVQAAIAERDKKNRVIDDKIVAFGETVTGKLPVDKAKQASALYRRMLEQESGFAHFGEAVSLATEFDALMKSLPVPNLAMFQEMTSPQGGLPSQETEINIWECK